MSKSKAATTRKPKTRLLPFDAARDLNDDAAIAEYMTAVLETEDPDLLLLALSDVARARGLAQVAKDAGLGRESLV
jgi:probable addiction module antidote protein